MKLVRFQTPVLTPWPPLGRLSGLQEEIDRLFDGTCGDAGGWSPAMELTETQDAVVVKAELAGFKREDLKVTLDDGVLTVAGERKSERKAEDAGVHRTERFYGRFERSISLPAPVADSQVKADYKDGVLTITLPKTEQSKPKEINVNAS